DVQHPELGPCTYVYDAAGRLTNQTDAKSQQTVLDYDSMDRVWRKTVSGPGLTTETTTNTFDDTSANGHAGYSNAGKLTDSVKGSFTERSDYDAGGRPIKQRWAGINDVRIYAELTAPIYG